MKSSNDLWIKSNSFCHLREQFNESLFPRCPVTESWQLFPRHLDTIHHLSKRGIVAHQIKPRHLFFHPSRCVLSLNSRCFNISFRELILYSSIFEKINPSIVFFLSSSRGWRSQKRGCQDQRMQWINNLLRCNLDHEDCVSFVSPLSSYLTSWISGRDSCLVGVSCHIPSFWHCTRLTSCVHHV